jgi:predicted O-linked N-acetylglucosamine transferase (SPINDLY family)
MRQRAVRAFDHFHEVKNKTDEEIVLLARALEIDIAFDLKGCTQGCRPRIFALRAAPIQINYLGYPGSMGVDYMDYLVADNAIIPQELAKFYKEKIILLPESYQCNTFMSSDDLILSTKLSEGVPQDKFIFCSFNNNYKITPSIFNAWMEILLACPDSALWLLEDNAIAAENLKTSAEKAGVSSNRLIFAKRVPLIEHLSRHKLAHLFLDTFPCSAHTTASDALRMDLPIVSYAGKSFASRVCTSLLRSVDSTYATPSTLEEYVQMACNHYNKYTNQKYRKNKFNPSNIFDAARYTHDFLNKISELQ